MGVVHTPIVTDKLSGSNYCKTVQGKQLAYWDGDCLNKSEEGDYLVFANTASYIMSTYRVTSVIGKDTEKGIKLLDKLDWSAHDVKKKILQLELIRGYAPYELDMQQYRESIGYRPGIWQNTLKMCTKKSDNLNLESLLLLDNGLSVE